MVSGEDSMGYSARFRYTHAIVDSLGIIEHARGVLKLLPLPPDQALFLKHRARFRSMMSSTAIEGNTLNTQESIRALVRPDSRETDMQQERRNYWRALEWIEQQADRRRPISDSFIRELHCLIQVRSVGRRGVLSSYRTTECPVVDSVTRQVDYAPPKPKDVSPLMADLANWLVSRGAAELPVPIRAGLLAHRFVSIHPFSDGNGRTARALATAELWLRGYEMRGFLSLEEFYTLDRARYYRSLQMGLPVNFYEGRHDPDHTEWLEYFLAMMAQAADLLRRTAEELNRGTFPASAPWESLTRQQQQVLDRILVRVLSGEPNPERIRPQDVSGWHGVSGVTAREWLHTWTVAGFTEPVTPDAQRFRAYRLASPWWSLVERAARSAVGSVGDNASAVGGG